tara:strand:+ start:1365 stop:1565 length:201 start_codon:yes stop_codon:yes gene_type:complete
VIGLIHFNSALMLSLGLGSGSLIKSLLLVLFIAAVFFGLIFLMGLFGFWGLTKIFSKLLSLIRSLF